MFGFFRMRRWMLLSLVLACVPAGVQAVEKIIRTPIETDYSVTDPAFRETISHHLHDPLVPGNKIQELVNGVEIFPAMLEAIRQATNTITFENFIWRSGELSDQFIEALSERARAGVKVHCSVDSFGAFKFKHADRRKLRSSGVELEIFNQIYPWNCWTWNHRTHRKILVVDGKI